jgi:hypothetical protein
MLASRASRKVFAATGNGEGKARGGCRRVFDGRKEINAGWVQCDRQTSMSTVELMRKRDDYRKLWKALTNARFIRIGRAGAASSGGCSWQLALGPSPRSGKEECPKLGGKRSKICPQPHFTLTQSHLASRVREGERLAARAHAYPRSMVPK